MKVTFIGTGTMGCVTRCNTSILVDDILFDMGMGTVKQIERLKIYTKAVKYLVITHFHGDHFLDLPNLLFGRWIRKEHETYKLIIIGPVGLRKKVVDLMCFSFGDGNEHKYDNIEERFNVEFIELSNEQQYITDRFRITALALKHGVCIQNQGYLLEKDNKKIAYACDTTLCDNYYKMCGTSDYLFSDVTGLKTTDYHMGLEDCMQLAMKYTNCTFYAVHRADYDTRGIEGIVFPNDGDIVKID